MKIKKVVHVSCRHAGIVTNQTNVGSASPVAVTAVCSGCSDRSCQVRWCGCTVLPPLSFFLYGNPTGGFKRGGSFVYGVSSGTTVSGYRDG